MQEILLGRSDHFLRPLRCGRNALAHDERLARHLRRRLCPRTHPVDAEQSKTEAVVLGRVLADEIAHDAGNGGKNLRVPRDEAGIGGAREEQCAMADHGRALQLDRVPLGRLERRPLDPRAPRIERPVGYMAQVGASGRLANVERIGLLVEAVGGDARRRGRAVRRHAFQLEPIIVENAEDSVAPTRHAA